MKKKKWLIIIVHFYLLYNKQNFIKINRVFFFDIIKINDYIQVYQLLIV